jgi:hypothetical protein
MAPSGQQAHISRRTLRSDASIEPETSSPSRPAKRRKRVSRARNIIEEAPPRHHAIGARPFACQLGSLTDDVLSGRFTS